MMSSQCSQHQWNQAPIRLANAAGAAPLQDTAATPLALARMRLANIAAPLRFASGETQGERCAQARRKE